MSHTFNLMVEKKMISDSCSWTLDASIRNRLSIREARIMTDKRLNVIFGKNGAGKSQLLVIFHSYWNTGDSLLKNMGYRNYFPPEASHVSINGPKKVYYIHSSRIIGRHPDEVQAGPYCFSELRNPPDIRNRYNQPRLLFSKLIYDARYHHNEQVRATRSVILAKVLEIFQELFPNIEFVIDVNEVKETVAFFVRQRLMNFVRPNDPSFKDGLVIPFSTISDGEMNCAFLAYEIIFRSFSKDCNTLFLIDEIENHLHPSLQDRFIYLLCNTLPERIMILATSHSPGILSASPSKSRYFMAHSTDQDQCGRLFSNQILCPSQETTAKCLYELYGASSGRVAAQLLLELSAVSKSKSVSFIEECFLPAGVTIASKGFDPQRTVLSGLIQALAAKQGKLFALDIGAGKGRLLDGLVKDFSSSLPKIEFDLIEPDESNIERLKRLSDIFQKEVKVNSVLKHQSEIPTGKRYHIIFLHNVVHEMSSSEFFDFLCRINDILETDGLISIFEQYVLPKGEKDYFVFSPESLNSLFKEIGCEVYLANRESFGGIPLYEIIIKKHDVVPGVDKISASLRNAVEKTIDRCCVEYANAMNEKSSLKAAFFSCNLANGMVRMRKDLILKDCRTSGSSGN